MMQLKRVKLNLRWVKCLITSCFVDSYHPLWLYFWRYQCNMIEKQLGLLYSWKCFPNSVRSNWLLWVHMTSISETVSRQNLWAGNIAKSMMSESNSALLPVKFNRRPLLQRGLMNFQLQNFQLYNKSHIKTGPSWNSKFCFTENLNASLVSASGNKINYFPRD